jgi:hypothetical protein
MANDTKAPFQDEGHLAPEERDDIQASGVAHQWNSQGITST